MYLEKISYIIMNYGGRKKNPTTPQTVDKTHKIALDSWQTSLSLLSHWPEVSAV